MERTKTRKTKVLSVIMTLLFAVILTSCAKDSEPTAIIDEDASSARAIYSSRSVSFTHPTGTYTSAMATSDFGNVSGWNQSRSYISSNRARATLVANTVGGSSGMTPNIDVSDGSEYELQFSVMFHSQFDWSRGGKVGFGFLIGDGNTGCDKADDGLGGSFRLMWYRDDNNRCYFRPYTYYKDMPENCGNSFGATYPSSGSLSKGTWYTVRMRVKSNTGTSTNGRVQLWVNGTSVLDRSIRWTTNDTKRKVRYISFHNFRGGSQSYWASSTVGYIYFDNLSWTRIAS